jgi:hypothetical protein
MSIFTTQSIDFTLSLDALQRGTDSGRAHAAEALPGRQRPARSVSGAEVGEF